MRITNSCPSKIGVLLSVIVVIGLFWTTVARAEVSALQTVETVVSDVRKTVLAKEDSVPAEELDEKLREIIAPVFDFKTMARSSLARHWKAASEEEQEEFVRLFSDLLAKTYLKRIRDNVAESEVTIADERTISKSKAVVKTIVEYEKSQAATIDYRMRKKDGDWLVYDVIIENIGLVSNYRQEFNGIVQREKVAGLIKRLREKSE